MLLFALCAAMGIADAMRVGNAMNPDGVAYLDLSDALLTKGPAGLVNAYWSPAYPAWLAATRAILRPSPSAEFLVAHLANLALYLVALVAFDAYFSALQAHRVSARDAAEHDPAYLLATWVFGYAVFAWGALRLVGLAFITPDLAVLALTLIVACLLIRADRRAFRASWWTALGGVLGIAYLFKAAMLPVALVVLGAAALAAHRARRSLTPMWAGIAALVVIAAPWIAALSHSAGHLIFGDAGRLNYAWSVDGVVPWFHWLGGPAGVGTPRHPLQVLHQHPIVYGFAHPIGGTYPLWYNPSYWYDGVTPTFNLHGQLQAIESAARFYARELWWCMVLIALLMLVADIRRRRAGVPSLAHVWAPMVAVLLMYGLVVVEGRYVGGAVVVLVTLAITSIPAPQRGLRAIVSTSILLGVAGYLAVPEIEASINNGFALSHGAPAGSFQQWKEATAVQALVGAGAPVAVIGSGARAYWARLARAHIVAELPEDDASAFWLGNAQTRQAVLDAFAHAGARVVIADGRSIAPDSTWLPASPGAWMRLISATRPP